MKFLENFRFMAQQINPCKFGKVVNEANIEIISANIGGCKAPYIQKTSSRGLGETLVDTG